MISEGACDSEDWSNDAENTALITGINYILLYSQKTTLLQQFYYFYCIFDQINAAFMRD